MAFAKQFPPDDVPVCFAVPEMTTSMESCSPRLPPEVLVKIFGLLGNKDRGSCAQVSKAWNRASNIPLLWQRDEATVDLDNTSTVAMMNLGVRRVPKVIIKSCSKRGALQSLLQCHLSLNTLDLRPWSQRPAGVLLNGLAVVHTSVTTLHLNLQTQDWPFQVLSALFVAFPNLENFTLGLKGSGESSDIVCRFFGAKLRGLKSLNLEDNRLSDLGLAFLLGVFQEGPCQSKLGDLRVVGPNFLTSQALNYLSQGPTTLSSIVLDGILFFDRSSLQLLTPLTGLQSLSLKGLRLRGEVMGHQGLCSESVVSLILDIWEGLREDDIKELPRCFPSLRYLNLPNSTLSLAAFLILTTQLRNLETLHLKPLTA